MKLVCLNAWGGKIYKPLMQYVKKQSTTTDVFCFQEVFFRQRGSAAGNGYCASLFSELETLLKNYNGYYVPFVSGVGFEERAPGVEFGQAMFVRKGLRVKKHGSATLYRLPTPEKMINGVDISRAVQWIMLDNVTIFNFHGLAYPWTKLDTPARLAQSKNLRKAMDVIKGRKILCGDFNLRPEPICMKMLEKGMKNLITEAGITSTRSRLFEYENKYSDYVLVTRDIKIKKFGVARAAVSDHLPLLLEFE